MPQTPAGQPLPGAVFELFEVRGDQDHGILAPLDTHSEDMPPGGDAGALHLWLRVHAAPDATPGIYGCLLTLQSGQWSARLPLTLRVHNVAASSPAADLSRRLSAVARSTNSAARSSSPSSGGATCRRGIELGRGGRSGRRAYFDWRRLGPDNWQFDFASTAMSTLRAGGASRADLYVGMFSTTGPTAIHYTDVDGTAQSVDCEPGSDIYQEAWTAFAKALVAHAEQGRGSRLVIWPADRLTHDDRTASPVPPTSSVLPTRPSTPVTADGAEKPLPLLRHVDIIALLWSVAIDLPRDDGHSPRPA